jgi:hypothetical protein
MTDSINRKISRLARNVTVTGTLSSASVTASEAAKWTTPRTITLGGDLSGDVTIDGSENVTLTATISSDTITLGTDTAGNYVATVTGGTGITVTGSGSETADVTISIDNTVATLTGTETLTNKTIDAATNTLSNIGNESLTNNSVTINSNNVSLGGSVTLDTDDVSEGISNFYHTTERVQDVVADQLVTNGVHTGISFTYDDVADGAIDATVSLTSFDTDDLSEGSTNLYYTDARARNAFSAGSNITIVDGVISGSAAYGDSDARAAISVTDSGGDGSLSYNNTTGVITYTGPSAAEVRAHFTAGSNITIVDGVISGSAAYGDADAREAISVTDSGGDGSLSYNNTTGVITYTGPSASEVRAHFTGGTGVTITDGSIAIGQDVGTTSNVTFNDLIVSGNLTVSGTTTTINTETINLADNTIVLNSNEAGSPTQDSGIEIERGTSTNVSLLWDETNDRWTIGTESFVAGSFIGNLTGDVTGTVSSLSNHNTDDVSEGSTNLYYTDARARAAFSAGSNITIVDGVISGSAAYVDSDARAAISVTDSGGDGSLSYNNTTGVITYTGPSSSEVRAHLSAGTGLTFTTGSFAIDSTVATLTGTQTLTNKTIDASNNTLSNIGNSSLTNSSITINGSSVSLGGTRTLVTDDISEDGSPTNLWYTDARSRAAISVTDSGGDGSLSYNSTTGVLTYTGPSAEEVRSHFTAGTGITIIGGQISAEATAVQEYTDADARAAISVSGGLSYNSSTGVITLSGYNNSNWDTAYGWGNHASAGYLTSLPSHTHDDRYYTESEADSRFINASGDTMTGDLVFNGHLYGRSVNAQYSNIYRIGGIYFTWDSDSYGTNFNHSITSSDGGSYADHITINSYGNVRINIDSNGNGTNYFYVGAGTTGTGGVVFTIDESGNGTFTGSGRAPIFYDSNNTGYYTDPASTSNLYNLQLSGSKHTYLHINPGANYEAMVRYTGGSGSDWYVGKRTTSQLVGTESFHFYSAASSRSVSGIDTAGNLFSDGSMRSPIFYDYNDTGRYIDPNGQSYINNLCVGTQNYTHGYTGVLQIGSTNHNYNFLNGSWASSITAGILANCADEWEFTIHDSGTSVESVFIYSSGRLLMGRSIGWGTTYVEAAESFRAPIFYDSNDTGYYVDPNGTSSFNQAIFYGNRLVIRGESPTLYLRDTNHRTSMIHCNSNLHYVLRGSGNDSETWSTYDSSWPFIINLSNNNIDMGGNLSVKYNVTAYSSDARLKDNVTNIENALEKVLKIRGVTFDWNETAEQNGFNPKIKYNDVGVIAQEVEEILPQVVELAPFDIFTPGPDDDVDSEEIKNKIGKSKSGNNYKTVDYAKLTPLLIEAIKEQQKLIEDLQNEMKNLR